MRVLPEFVLNITNILQDQSLQRDDKINFYAVVASIGDKLEQINANHFFRAIQLIDDSSNKLTLECKLWKQVAIDPQFAEEDVIFVKNAKLDVYNGERKVIVYDANQVSLRDDQRSQELKAFVDYCNEEDQGFEYISD